mgnify:CR=1 FL=1
MEIIKREKGEFGEIKIDFYLNKDRAILVTIEQLAQGFGYKNRKGIEKMIERNPYLKEEKFSVADKLSGADGKKYETRLFKKRGIFEIGMLSRTEKGKAFRAWIYDYIEELEKENANFRFQRALEKPTHKTLNEAISKWDNAPKPPHGYSIVSNLLLKLSTGKNKKKLIEDRGGKTGLDCLTSVELAKYQAYEKAIIPLIELNMEYSVIRDTLSQVQL